MPALIVVPKPSEDDEAPADVIGNWVELEPLPTTLPPTEVAREVVVEGVVADEAAAAAATSPISCCCCCCRDEEDDTAVAAAALAVTEPKPMGRVEKEIREEGEGE